MLGLISLQMKVRNYCLLVLRAIIMISLYSLIQSLSFFDKIALRSINLFPDGRDKAVKVQGVDSSEYFVG